MLEVWRHAVNRTPMRPHRFFALHAPTALSRSQSLIDCNRHPLEYFAKSGGWVTGWFVVAANVRLLCDECLCDRNRHPFLHFADGAFWTGIRSWRTGQRRHRVHEALSSTLPVLDSANTVAGHPPAMRPKNSSMSRIVLGADAARFSKKSRRNRRSLRRVCPNRQMPAVASKITSKTVADC
jgi:hypothetical protein